MKLTLANTAKIPMTKKSSRKVKEGENFGFREKVDTIKKS